MTFRIKFKLVAKTNWELKKVKEKYLEKILKQKFVQIDIVIAFRKMHSLTDGCSQ